MSVLIGIVIECGNPAFEGCAKVRIPELHGLPLTSELYNQMREKFKDYAKANTKNGSNTHSMYEYSIESFGKSNNTKVVPDYSVPWYPICFPFGSNVGPNQFDIVYVLDNAYIIGWSGEVYCPTK